MDWKAAKYAAKQSLIPDISGYREDWNNRETLKDELNRQTPGGVIGTHLSFIAYDVVVIGLGVLTDTIWLAAFGGSLLLMTAISMVFEFRNNSDEVEN